jgi:ComEC/Rec2-related protein
MFQLILISLCFLLIFQPSLHKASAVLALPLHHACLSQLPEMSHYHSLMAAVVCGENLPSSSASFALYSTGLVHFVMASGTHLLLLERFLNWIEKALFKREVVPRWIVFLLLGLYTLVTLLRPALVRALVQFALSQLSKKKKLFLRPAQLTLLSGSIVLIYAPEWYDSVALRLSWLAALILFLPWKKPHKRLKRQIALYFFFIPLLLSFSFPNPLSIFCNWLLAPVFGIALFPASVLSTLIHLLTPLSDGLWRLFDQCLQIALSFTVPIGEEFAIPAYWQWLYLCGLQLIFLNYEKGAK